MAAVWRQTLYCARRFIPTARQQAISEPKSASTASGWGWAKLLQGVFGIDMATCRRCQQGSLRIIAAITQAAVIAKILPRLKLSADPPPMAPARVCQGTLAWASS